ncbi:hypothetical protein LX36DRAFT_431813 [Colletotrichum falcatum]|nr:hypothetical protein LX36DRAFT_431813 [Colletotrichum falcatum]
MSTSTSDLGIPRVLITKTAQPLPNPPASRNGARSQPRIVNLRAAPPRRDWTNSWLAQATACLPSLFSWPCGCPLPGGQRSRRRECLTSWPNPGTAWLPRCIISWWKRQRLADRRVGLPKRASQGPPSPDRENQRGGSIISLTARPVSPFFLAPDVDIRP